MPASIVIDETKSNSQHDVIRANLDKNSYAVKKSEKNGHSIIEISFH
ncbi:hypothetical protein M902_1801 [Bacteriovorax sp. BAL6_X]|nr:hypothetical protein [Bacteriovorax sp. BAL6_X]EPZ51667.1 hypothetical protein M902_1801 [Bacteriovorax sp. BAL6_X]